MRYKLTVRLVHGAINPHLEVQDFSDNGSDPSANIGGQNVHQPKTNYCFIVL